MRSMEVCGDPASIWAFWAIQTRTDRMYVHVCKCYYSPDICQAWCRLGATYASPYPPEEIGGEAHHFFDGEPRDFPIKELEVFAAKRS